MRFSRLEPRGFAIIVRVTFKLIFAPESDLFEQRLNRFMAELGEDAGNSPVAVFDGDDAKRRGDVQCARRRQKRQRLGRINLARDTPEPRASALER